MVPAAVPCAGAALCTRAVSCVTCASVLHTRLKILAPAVNGLGHILARHVRAHQSERFLAQKMPFCHCANMFGIAAFGFLWFDQCERFDIYSKASFPQ